MMDEDWYQALRTTWANVCDRLSGLDPPEDECVLNAVASAVQALHDVSTELVVVEAKESIKRHQDAIDEQRELLKALGREYD